MYAPSESGITRSPRSGEEGRVAAFARCSFSTVTLSKFEWAETSAAEAYLSSFLTAGWLKRALPQLTGFSLELILLWLRQNHLEFQQDYA